MGTGERDARQRKVPATRSIERTPPSFEASIKSMTELFPDASLKVPRLRDLGSERFALISQVVARLRRWGPWGQRRSRLLAADHPTGSGGVRGGRRTPSEATKPSVAANESLMTCVASASQENRPA